MRNVVMSIAFCFFSAQVCTPSFAQQTGSEVTESVGDSGVSAERFQPHEQSNPSISGVFEPYNLYNQLKVTATIIANPKKMDDVTIGYVYDAGDIVKNASASEEFSSLVDRGVAAVAFKRGRGFEVLGGRQTEQLCGSLTLSNEECLAILVKKPNEDYKVIAVPERVGGTRPQGPVIGWDSQVAPAQTNN